MTFFLPTTINKSEHLKLMNYNFEFFQLGFKEIPICPNKKQALWFGCVFQINCLLSRRPKDQPCRRHFVHCKISFFRENYVFFFFFSKLLDIILRNLFFESLFNCWPINYLSQQLVFFPVSQYWFRDSVCTREEKMRIMSLNIKDMDSISWSQNKHLKKMKNFKKK